MYDIRPASGPIIVIVFAWLTAFGISCTGVTSVMNSPTPVVRGPSVADDFQATLAKVDAAQLEIQNGRPEAFKAIWSHADDVTLAGGFGGPVEKGWEQISRRLDLVGAQYSNGTHTHERIVASVSGDLGYVVQTEHIRFHVPGQAKESTRDYRVTMVIRASAGHEVP